MDAWRTNARRLLGGALALATVAALPACGGDESEAADAADRPAVTFTADDTSIDAPDEVASGLVAVTLETAPGEVGHHIFVARLDDGVSSRRRWTATIRSSRR